jgi:hypothetical protein
LRGVVCFGSGDPAFDSLPSQAALARQVPIKKSQDISFKKENNSTLPNLKIQVLVIEVHY